MIDLETVFVSLIRFHKIDNSNLFINLLQFLLTLKMSRTTDFNCHDMIFERKFDCCKINDNLLNSMFVNIFYKNVGNTANFDLKCPYRAGRYELNNFTVSIPSFMPFPNNTNICLTNKFYGRFSGFKKFDYLGSLTAYLSYNR